MPQLNLTDQELRVFAAGLRVVLTADERIPLMAAELGLDVQSMTGTQRQTLQALLDRVETATSERVGA